MRILLQFLKKVKKFRTYLFQDKLLILKAFFITGIMRIVLILVPFKVLKKHIGKYDEESEHNIDNINTTKIEKIGWVVTKISRYTPWKSKCLVQALTAQRLLCDKGLESTLYLGVSRSVNKGILDAHAWIRCGNIYVTGGNGEKFSIVARFKK